MSKIVIYETDSGSVEVRLDRESVWLTQKQLAELFDTSTDNISLHLKNIYAEEELEERSTTEESSVVQKEGKRQTEITSMRKEGIKHEFISNFIRNFRANCNVDET